MSGQMKSRADKHDSADRFDSARAIAEAVLYEGYVLYPYRASSAKNQLRWQFGVLTARATSRGTRPSTGLWTSRSDRSSGWANGVT